MKTDEFWSKADIDPDGCWQWVGRIDVGGYGRYSGRLAHRIAYELSVGPIPSGLQIDHLCRNRACVNPLHLEPVTLQENHARGRRATATRCLHGHEYTPSNTYLRPDDGSRGCRRCVADAQMRYQARRKAERNFA